MKRYVVTTGSEFYAKGDIITGEVIRNYMFNYGNRVWDGTVKDFNGHMILQVMEINENETEVNEEEFENKINMKSFDQPERKRKYIYRDGTYYELLKVLALAVSDSGTHRLKLNDGTHVIVPTGWIAIELDIDDWSY